MWMESTCCLPAKRIMRTIWRSNEMNAVYITISGTNHYYGNEFMKAGMTVELVKEPDNEHDCEAIIVKMDGLGRVGYVTNSPFTVLGESISAGRLYDKIGEKEEAVIVYVLPKGVICRVDTGRMPQA